MSGGRVTDQAEVTVQIVAARCPARQAEGGLILCQVCAPLSVR